LHFRLKTPVLVLGTDRANWGVLRKSAFVTWATDTGFPARIAQRFTPVGNCQLFRVVCEASQFEAQFTLCEEANYERFFGALRRVAKKFGQGLKLSQRELRQFKLIPAFWLKIVHEFGEQRLACFHQIIPASLKPEIAWPTVERLTDNNVIEHFDLQNPGSSASLRVSRISASLGAGSPEGWLCYVECKSMCGVPGKHLNISHFAEHIWAVGCT
jgi:hypothetical protein